MKATAIGVIPPNVPSARKSVNFGKREESLDLDEWKERRADFEDLKDNSEAPGFVKKVADVGILLASGVVTYGTARYGITKAYDAATSMANSNLVKAFRTDVITVTKDTVIPALKRTVRYIGDTSFVTSMKDKYTKFASGEKVAPKIAWVKSKAIDGYQAVKAKLPTKDTVGRVTRETLAISSGVAGAATGAEIAHEHEDEAV